MKKITHIFYKSLDVLTDILIIPIIILCVICTASLLSARNNGEVPYLFGVAATTVLTTSMQPEFNPGDTVLIKQVPIKDLRVGDYIGFYNASSEINTLINTVYANPNCDLKKDKIYDIDLEGQEEKGLTYLNNFKDRVSVLNNYDFAWYDGENGQSEVASSSLTGSNKDAIKYVKNQKRVFHKIIGLYIDNNSGQLYCITWGINNYTRDKDTGKITGYQVDNNIIPADWIIGKYEKGNGFLKTAGTVIGFCGSLQGIIWLVEVPCGIMLLMLSIQLIQQIDEYLQDKNRRKRALENPMLKNRARAVEGRRVIRKKITSRFKIWFNKFLYFGAGDEKSMEIRRVRNAKLALRKSMATNFTSQKPVQNTTTQVPPNQTNTTQNPTNSDNNSGTNNI